MKPGYNRSSATIHADRFETARRELSMLKDTVGLERGIFRESIPVNKEQTQEANRDPRGVDDNKIRKAG
jgi:hypothetical protein